MSCTQGKVDTEWVIVMCNKRINAIHDKLEKDEAELTQWIRDNVRKGFFWWKRPLTEEEIQKERRNCNRM